jgi:Delta7-sterol 5-desaturase
MDVVLEVFDTFAFDRLYANLVPLQPNTWSFDPASSIGASWSGCNDLNATYDAAPKAAGRMARSGWQYEPASSYFRFEPTEYAYISRWDRDNIWRQFLSLYVITV